MLNQVCGMWYTEAVVHICMGTPFAFMVNTPKLAKNQKGKKRKQFQNSYYKSVIINIINLMLSKGLI